MPCWLSYFQALSIPILGLITTWIAVWQYLDNRLKLRMEHYDRRVRIYQETVKFLSIVLRDLNPQFPDMLNFNAATAEADFVFPPEIRQYLDEVFEPANNLNLAATEYRGNSPEPLPGYDHIDVVNRKSMETKWFLEQHQKAKQLFMPHLKLWR